FGAICGSVPACISTMSAVAYPEMRKREYSPALAGSCIAAGAALSVLIPPSTNFIIYGLATETSIGRLFVAGIVPGLLLCTLNILAIVYTGRRHSDWAPKSEKSTWKERWHSIAHGGLIEIAIIFIIAMGGMFAGFFTPTEAGVVGAFGMLVVTAVTRKLNFNKFVTSLGAGVRLQAMVFVLLACASVFGKMFTLSTIPVALGKFVEALDVPRWGVMPAILFIYFLLGMVTDLLSMTLVTMPIFFPIVVDLLGYDAVWFGVIISMMIAVGGITPPVGTGIFLVKGCISADDKEATLSKLFSGVWPFVIAAMAATVLFVFFPQLCTWLPTIMYSGT
ncbi:MAG: TRAP transporter large permease, partial [Clostridiales Family XIII bacterium]|nr:TRAP transporter large permease [Clostridiales Family XIII bacterium]